MLWWSADIMYHHADSITSDTVSFRPVHIPALFELSTKAEIDWVSSSSTLQSTWRWTLVRDRHLPGYRVLFAPSTVLGNVLPRLPTFLVGRTDLWNRRYEGESWRAMLIIVLTIITVQDFRRYGSNAYSAVSFHKWIGSIRGWFVIGFLLARKSRLYICLRCWSHQSKLFVVGEHEKLFMTKFATDRKLLNLVYDGLNRLGNTEWCNFSVIIS